MNIALLLIAAIMGATITTVFFFVWENRKLLENKNKGLNLLDEAKKQSEDILKQSKIEAENILKEAKKEANDTLVKSEKIEEKILEKEEKLDQKLDEIEKKRENLKLDTEALAVERDILAKKIKDLDGKLSELSKLTEEEAREIFLKQIEEKYEEDALQIITKHKKKIEERKKEEAREIIVKSIQQYAFDVTSEVTTTIITLPSDDLKGKLIGKEGRNITAFERATGVALIVDDTPDSVFISAFDLFKRYIAKKSLEKLIEDGRIQPARIEEVVAITEAETDILLKDLGTKVCEELNIETLPDEIIPIIGKLRFRTSYGQNILKHSKEVALIAESIANDLGLDSKMVKIGGLLHDIGKALDQEIEGTHPEIGAKVARKYKLPENIVDMIENHHGEQFSISLEAAVVQVADAISSVRPGARREAIEQYVKRVQEMEALVASFSGVNKVYAISAGREVRVFVDANTVSDLQAQQTAKQIATDIQEKLSYPGEVKVNLIREMRVIEYAK